MDRRLSVEGGYFRPESPWLPGLRKINPEQSIKPASIRAVIDPPEGDQSSGSPAGDPPAGGPPGQDMTPSEGESPAHRSTSSSPAPDKNGVMVSDLTASWNGSSEEPTLKDISIELTEVGLCHVRIE